MNTRTLLALVALALGPSLPRVALAQDTPSAMPARVGTSWVYDGTATLGDSARRSLDALIDDAWTRANTRLAVALVRDTAPRPVDDYALTLFRAWSLGDSTAGRAALLVVAVSARRNHIVAGSETLAAMPEDFRRHVLDDVFRPTARAQGVEAATLRAMEALRDRVISAPPTATPPAPSTQPAIPSTPQPAIPTHLDDPAPPPVSSPEAPHDDGLPIGGLAVAGVGLGIAFWNARKRRAEALARCENGLAFFEVQERRFRDLATRFPKLALGADPAEAPGGYREAATDMKEAPVEALIAPLRARIKAAKSLTRARAADEIDAVTRTFGEMIAPLDDAERRETSTRGLVPVLAEKIRAMPQLIAENRATIAAMQSRWPGERFEDETQRVLEAELRAGRYAKEHAELLATIDFERPHSVAAGHSALSRLDAHVDRAIHDATAPRRRHETLLAAEKKLTELSTELTATQLSALVQAHPAATRAQIDALKRAHHDADKLQREGDDLVSLVTALEALRVARVAVESARVVASHSYDASSVGYASSSGYTSSDCASSDCASSDCASSDCASSDCASSDCASSDCSSDCGGSSGDW